MKIGIYSNNIQVNTTLVSMCANCGCKFVKILRYDKNLFKGTDIVIIDLDNCSDSKDILTKDVEEMSEILFLGISKNDEILDTFRGVMNVEKKPFNLNIFNAYKNEVLIRLESNNVVNKEENRIYDEFGTNLADTFNQSNIAIEERLNILKTKIKVTSNYSNESNFIKEIGLSNIEIVSSEKVDTSEKFDIEQEISNDALFKYRIRKLKLLNLSNQDIQNKIDEMMNFNINISINRKQANLEEVDLLTKLREGKLNNNIGKVFNEKKALLESKKEPVSIDIKIEESTIPKREIPEGPPLKKDSILLKPQINLDKNNTFSEKTEEEKSKKSLGDIPLKKPLIDMHYEKSLEGRQKLLKELKPPLISPPRKIQEEREEDPLEKLRNLKGEKSSTKTDDTDDKTIIKNINNNKNIQDNNEMIGKTTSLVERMKQKIGASQLNVKKETLSDIVDKKSKPPRI